MRHVFATVAEWLRRGKPCALGTLVEAYDSAPAPIGTTIAVDESGRIAGNIGAGCHEGEIVEACQQTIHDGQTRELQINLTSADEIDGAPGCGGKLRIAVWKPALPFALAAQAIADGVQDVTVSIPDGFEFSVRAKRRLVLVGATSLAQEIAHMARALDFLVTVVDPRPFFATPERIPDASELVLEWPDEFLPRVLPTTAALVIVSHDPKFDLAALRCALQSDVPYIGLLGSRRSQAARRDALRELGFAEAQLARIHGPTGLDLGGSSASETALSILGQIVAAHNGRRGGPLDESLGAIHARSAATTSATAI